MEMVTEWSHESPEGILEMHSEQNGIVFRAKSNKEPLTQRCTFENLVLESNLQQVSIK